MRFDRLTTCALGLWLAGCATAPKAPAHPPKLDELLAKIDEEIAAEARAKHWPDVAIGLVYDGKLAWWRGHGEVDAASHAPVTDQTYFRFGSVTKTFTGLALLQLRDAGKLSLDDPLEKFVPEVRGVVYPTGEHPPIRLRHLVTHTSGIPSMPPGADFTDPGRVLTEADVLAALDGLRLEGTPGAFEGYSNYANCLSGVVVHRVSGVTYEEYVLTRIAAPLGLGIRWRQEDVPSGRLAMGHERDATGAPGGAVVELPRSWVMGACNACGGLFGSLADLGAYAAFQLSAWPPRSGPESPVASRETLRDSQSQHSKVFGVNWGMSYEPGLGHVVGHVGGAAGYSSVVVMAPDHGIAMVGLLGLGHTGDLDKLVNAIFREVAPAL
jgi:CubicO group peptidase (beta-lactamase class C family)